MTVIRQEDLIQSVADALQYISYYHPMDYITALGRAYEQEQSPAAKDAIAQILTNSRMCAEGKRPICQDTGIVTVFLKVGMNVRWDGATMSLEDMVNEGVRRAYNDVAALGKDYLIYMKGAGSKGRGASASLWKQSTSPDSWTRTKCWHKSRGISGC